ncbi:MAG TPA: hypothetical protein VK623_06100 [Flavobacterium sp.]|nr:hypothetical protein [Flavobacterium sp.]
MSKTINILLTGIIILLFASCKEEKEKPKVIYGNTAKVKTEVPAVDTTILEIADLPVEITGTNYLIHPIGDVRFDQKARYGSSSGGGDVSYTISNYNEFEITGFLRNLKFQQVGSDSLTVLTDKPVLIQTATFLKSVADKTKQQFLVYTLADMDTNKDDKLDASDIKSLYISTIGGEKFTKLSTDFEELIDWKIIDSKNRLYFRTIEDTNKNGEFDKDDVLHYNYLDLLGKEWKVVNYRPI